MSGREYVPAINYVVLRVRYCEVINRFASEYDDEVYEPDAWRVQFWVEAQHTFVLKRQQHYCHISVTLLVAVIRLPTPSNISDE